MDYRKRQYQHYTKRHNLDGETWLKEGSFTSASGYEMMKEILQMANRPTAVFAASDAIAFGAMRAISEAGLSVPKDISVIGFNDVEACKSTTPALTSIHAPAYDMGAHGANLGIRLFKPSDSDTAQSKDPVQINQAGILRGN